MTNWKCNCGVINFATDAICKKCQSCKPESGYPSQPVSPYFDEHAADEGNAAIGVLKAVAVACALGGVGFAVLFMTTEASAEYQYSIVIAALVACAGIVLAAFVYGFAVLIENVVARRKNSQHLAGIRANIIPAEQANWQG